MGRTERDYTRVFVPAGATAHLLDPLCSPNSSGATSLCGRTAWPGYWHGTGSQDEEERGQDLRVCPSCAAIQRDRDGGVFER